MEATPVGWVDQLWATRICSSNPQPLLGKVKTFGQGCDFHGSSAAIPSTPCCVFVMRHILLTKGLLQAIQAIQSILLCFSCWLSAPLPPNVLVLDQKPSFWSFPPDVKDNGECCYHFRLENCLLCGALCLQTEYNGVVRTHPCITAVDTWQLSNRPQSYKQHGMLLCVFWGWSSLVDLHLGVGVVLLKMMIFKVKYFGVFLFLSQVRLFKVKLTNTNNYYNSHCIVVILKSAWFDIIVWWKSEWWCQLRFQIR